MRGMVEVPSAEKPFPRRWDVATASSSPKERGLGPRPALSPLLGAALCAWLAVTVACLARIDARLGLRWGVLRPAWVVAGGGAVLVAVCAAVAWKVPRCRPWCLWALVGLVAGGLRGDVVHGRGPFVRGRLDLRGRDRLQFYRRDGPQNLLHGQPVVSSACDHSRRTGGARPGGVGQVARRAARDGPEAVVRRSLGPA